MKTANDILSLDLAEIVKLINDYVADPYSSQFPYIVPNSDEFLDEVAEKKGGAFLTRAIRNGKYDPQDTWAICLEDCPIFRTFSGQNELFFHIITPEDIAERYNLTAGE